MRACPRGTRITYRANMSEFFKKDRNFQKFVEYLKEEKEVSCVCAPDI